MIILTAKFRLGIELTKILVLQYSNQETSVTIGESVRDEDGMQNPADPEDLLELIVLQYSSCNLPHQATSTMPSWSF